MSLKKFTLCAIALFSVLGTVLSENSAYCRIVVYRNNSVSENGIAYKILSNNTLITELENNSYYSFYMPVGPLNIKAYYMTSAEIDLPVVKNMTCFVRLDLETVNTKQVAKLVVVDSLLANREMMSANIANARISVKQRTIPSNRIGINVGAGWGFSNTPVVSTTYADAATISFGGGLEAMLCYTHEFSENVGMDINLVSQYSSIMPRLTNATVSFTRNSLSVSPIIIIPINSNDEKRVKLGVGFDYYYSTDLSFELDKLQNGFNDSWTYDHPFGYHISGMYEESFKNKWSGQVGLVLADVKYRYVSAKNDSYPSDKKLGNPSGTALYFVLGLGYHF